MSRSPTTLTDLARLGFSGLTAASRALGELDRPDLVPAFALAADPDQALAGILKLRERAPATVESVLADDEAVLHLIRVLGASTGLEAFFVRNPHELVAFAAPLGAPPLNPRTDDGAPG